MKVRQVEVYSDTTNRAVMRHPDRHFPGALIQGDTLYGLCKAADAACDAARKEGCEVSLAEMNRVRNALWDHLNHYTDVLSEHGLPIPFSRTVA